MINIMLVIFGGLALYLYFLPSDDKNATTADRGGVGSTLTNEQQIANLRSTSTRLKSQISEISAKIEGLKREHAEAVKARSAKGSVALGTLKSDPIFFENAMRREEAKKAALQSQLNQAEAQIRSLTPPAK